LGSLFGQTPLVLDETPKAIPPFGGRASFATFLGQIGYAREVRQHLPVPAPTSNNAIPLAPTLTAFVGSVRSGARRFAHCQGLQADHVLHALLGLERFPGDDPIRDFFRRFTRAHLEAFWRPLRRWLLRRLACPKAGFSWDLDSTGFCRERRQEGAAKGHHPRRPGRKSHHPILAALAGLPEGRWIRCARADSGFFEEALWGFLEARNWPCLVVARLTATLKRRCAGIQDWTLIDAHPAVGEFAAQLFGGSKARRFVGLRERAREGKDAVGRRRFDCPGHPFRVWVTNRSEGARWNCGVTPTAGRPSSRGSRS
jgi:hypothetical protein